VDSPISSATVAGARLEDWVLEFGIVYEKQLSRESVPETWLGFVQQAGEVAECIRTQDLFECLGKIAKSFCWLCCFVRRCGLESTQSAYRLSHSFSEIVLSKYPRRCPRCGFCPCACYNSHAEGFSQSSSRNSWDAHVEHPTIKEKEFTVDRFVEMFESIYGLAHEGLSLENIGFHLYEEVGEVTNAIRLLSREAQFNGPAGQLGLESEIADTFSWLCMLYVKLRKTLGRDTNSVEMFESHLIRSNVRSFLFSHIVWTVYADGEKHVHCPACGHRPCIERVPESAAKTVTLPKRKSLVIAIDGPSGSGKSTIAKRVAQKLQLRYVNTGAMYRAVALLALREKLQLEDETSLAQLLERADMEVIWVGDEMHLLVDGEDMTSLIRTPEIDSAVRKVAALPVTRAKLLALQRNIAQKGGVAMEGRDIGTVVFPEADLKIFLDAAPEVRAERRWKEHRGKGETMTLAEVLEEVRERDKHDRERKVSPLVRAADAVLVDNTAMDAEETARVIVMLAREREKELAKAAGREA
jgi:cytidylate kinase